MDTFSREIIMKGYSLILAIVFIAVGCAHGNKSGKNGLSHEERFAYAFPNYIDKDESSTVAVVKHRIKKGETLGHISKKYYGTSKKWKTIWMFNFRKYPTPQSLRSGSIIKIPKEVQSAVGKN